MTNYDDHRPDSPFGCTATWGPALPPGLPDGGLHICNSEDMSHRGEHTCKCGAKPIGLTGG